MKSIKSMLQIYNKKCGENETATHNLLVHGRWQSFVSVQTRTQLQASQKRKRLK